VFRLVAGVLCFLAGVVVWFWLYPDQPGPVRTASVTVDIPAGSGLVGIKKILVQAGVIRDDLRFVLLAKRIGVARHLKAGEYAFAPGLSPRAVILELATGKTVPRAITLPEGFTLYQVAEVINTGGWARMEEFWQLVTDPLFISDFGLQADTLEGYLFPDTYFFEKGTGLRVIVSTMVKRMVRVLEEERSLQGQDESGANGVTALSRHEVLILASIVEKETALASERPLVAKVFLNRLRLGMKLQTDPTVNYGIAKFGVPLTKDDLKTASPYNTYAIQGLPAGPICNPGRAAIVAALNPAAVDYTYFVSENDGSHYFSKTLNEHNQAVARYRKKRGVTPQETERSAQDSGVKSEGPSSSGDRTESVVK
jgi:UPF0755 protein